MLYWMAIWIVLCLIYYNGVKFYSKRSKIFTISYILHARSNRGIYIYGAPGAIRTRSPRLRRAMLYPVEPRVHYARIIITEPHKIKYFIAFFGMFSYICLVKEES